MTVVDRRRAEVVVVGGGPGGYVAAIRCAQLGLDTVVVDDRPLGGTCLNIGCIPSKALIHAADDFARAVAQAGGSATGVTVADPTIDVATTRSWIDGIVGRLNRGVGSLITRAGGEVVVGRAEIVDGRTVRVAASGGPVELTTEHLVIATGSVPVELPDLPFGGPVLSSTGALALTTVPRSLAVVGGGYIGVELGTAYAKLGAHVTIVEATDALLGGYDGELTGPVARRLGQLDVEVLTGALAVAHTDGQLRVERPDADGRTTTIPVPAERVLVTVGRRPATDGWGLARLGLTMDGPFVAVDERCATSMHQVWAVGDVTGEPMLAHRAMRQGEVVADAIAGRPAAFDPAAIPAVVFSDPEIVTVGLDPAGAEAVHGEVVVGRFPLRANSRTMTLDQPLDAASGLVRVVARASDGLVVGIQAVGVGVAELAGQLALALEMAATVDDVALTIEAHPTIGEAVAEAALDALGRRLHH